MDTEARLTRILACPGVGIVAADVEGRVHVLDGDLRRVRSSRPSFGWGTTCGAPIYALAVDGRWIYTRDKVGNICRWSLDGLRLVNRLDAAATSDAAGLLPGEEPSPTMIRGFGVWQGRGYVGNGYHQLVVIDLADFSVEEIVDWPYGARRLESFCVDRGDLHAVSDREGNVYLGRLDDLQLPVCVHVDDGNVHRVKYDRRHDRFWATLDAGLGEERNIRSGIATVTPTGEVDQRSLWARNDVECVELSPDCTRVYTGGFDGTLQIFDNRSRELVIERVVTGFSHQIIDCTVDDEGWVYVLCQDGELVKLAPDGEFVARLGFGRQCVWDICEHPTTPGVLLAAIDDGVAEVRVTGSDGGPPALDLVGHHPTGLGFSRRVLALPDGWCGIAWDRSVFRAGLDGALRWTTTLDDIVHTISVSPDGERLLVTTTGGAVELVAATGARLTGPVHLTAPVWAGCYLDPAEKLVATSNGRLTRLGADGTTAWSVDIGDYPKRIQFRGDRVHISGGGGIKEVLLEDGRVVRVFKDLLDNTVENSVLVDGVLCAVSYGMQMAAYDYESGELLALFEDLPDFAKGIAVARDRDGSPLVVVGGRGGYLRLYRISAGDPGEPPVVSVLGDTWLPAAQVTQPPRVLQCPVPA